jgi:NAD+ kinase
MKIALYGKTFNSEFLEYFRLLDEAFEKYACQMVLWEPLYRYLDGKVAFRRQPELFDRAEQLLNSADMVFSAGGDGTILDSVRLVRDSGIPIAGINLGRMGFLSSIPRSEIIPALDDIFNHRYRIVNRTLIDLQQPEGLFGDFPYAFNELSINKKDNSSMVVVHVWVNNQFLHSYWADGLIVATPTGSTAYSLSCGGPIITPDSNNFVITPIAPHNLSVRPFVIPDNSEVRIKVDSRDNQALVALDSQSVPITPETELIIRKAGFGINLVQRQNEDFFSTIRAKLHWGSDIRN